MSAFRGSGSTDTGRFEDKTLKMMNKIKFPPELDQKINMEKVELEPFKKWIAMKTESILGIDDDILTNLIFNMLQKEQFPSARYIYVQLVPFLERHVRKFMMELWELLDSAQESGTGIPQAMLDTLRKELDSKKREQDKIGSALEKRYGDNRGSRQSAKKEKAGDKDYQDFRTNKRRERENERERQREKGRDQNHDQNRDRGDRGGRDRERDRRGRRRSRERSRDERDSRSRRRPRDRDRGSERKSARTKRQPRSPEPPRVKTGKKRKQMPSPSPPACLKRKKPETVQAAETTKRSSSSDSSSSEDSSSSSDS